MGKISPFQILGIPENSDDVLIREAYLKFVKAHPPDRDPEGFTRIRKAYDQIKDPETRIANRFLGSGTHRTIDEMLVGLKEEKVCVGPKLWLDLISSARKE